MQTRRQTTHVLISDSGATDATHQTIPLIHCQYFTDEMVRIIAADGSDSDSNKIGRAEVFYDNQWGTICSWEWNVNCRSVFCKTKNPNWR